MTRLPRVDDADAPALVSQPPGDQSVSATPADTLQQALRRARSGNRERTAAVADLRSAEIARLEALDGALQPLFAEVRAESDLFEFELRRGSRPRLFIDAICFVEMGEDARLFRLIQDTRRGRVKIADDTAIEPMVRAIADYVAHRLIEREQALTAAEARPSRPEPLEPASPANEAGHSPRARPGWLPFQLVSIAFAFLIDLLGALTLIALCAIGCWYMWAHSGLLR